MELNGGSFFDYETRGTLRVTGERLGLQDVLMLGTMESEGRNFPVTQTDNGPSYKLRSMNSGETSDDNGTRWSLVKRARVCVSVGPKPRVGLQAR